MSEILSQYGFSKYDQCNCHGTFTEKYTDAAKTWRVIIKPRKWLFEIYKFENFKFSGMTTGDALEQKLIEYGFTKVV